MKSFKQYLLESGGEAAGKLEIAKTDVKKARAYAEKVTKAVGIEMLDLFPDFEKNYALAKKQANKGFSQRKDMPVITDEDVRAFQHRLKKGTLDFRKPYSSDEVKKNPFPEGLKGAEAKSFLERGLKKHDGDNKDDVVKLSKMKVEAGKLLPIQKQIYFDKGVKFFTEFGIESTRQFLTNKSTFIVSKDNYIIDGHHRFLATVLLDPKIKVNVLKIDLPVDQLVPLALAYGDAIGNRRNA